MTLYTVSVTFFFVEWKSTLNTIKYILKYTDLVKLQDVSYHCSPQLPIFSCFHYSASWSLVAFMVFVLLPICSNFAFDVPIWTLIILASYYVCASEILSLSLSFSYRTFVIYIFSEGIDRIFLNNILYLLY